MIYIFFNSDGTPNSIVSTTTLTQGSYGIPVYVAVLNDSDFDPSDYVGKIAIKRSDNSISPALTMSVTNFVYNETTYKGYMVNLNSDWYFAKAGTLQATVSIATYSSGTVVSNFAYGTFSVQIQASVTPTITTTITDEQYDSIQAALLSKLNKVDGIIVGSIDDLTEDDFVPNQMYFDTVENEFRWTGQTLGTDEAVQMKLHLGTGSTITGTISGNGTYTGNNTYSGNNTFSGSNTFSGTTEFTSTATFTQAYITTMTVGSLLSNTASIYTLTINTTLNLGTNAIFNGDSGITKVATVPTLNFSDSTYYGYAVNVYTLKNYMSENRTAISSEIATADNVVKETCLGAVSSLQSGLTSGSITPYGAIHSVYAINAEVAEKANKDGENSPIHTTYVKIANVVDALNSTETTKPLSANQGRVLYSAIQTINSILSSDDTDLDTIQEIVDYITSNKDLIDTLSTNKINYSDIVDNLTSAITNKPLSANQGYVLKGLIDDIVDGTTTVAEATHATNADSATSATSATNATNATNDEDGNRIKTHYYSKEDGFAIGLVSITDYDEDTGNVTLEYNSEAVTAISYDDSTGVVTFTY